MRHQVAQLKFTLFDIDVLLQNMPQEPLNMAVGRVVSPLREHIQALDSKMDRLIVALRKKAEDNQWR